MFLSDLRSTLKSCSEVELSEPSNGNTWAQLVRVPIVAANMDTVGTFSMARSLAKHSMITAIHKHYTLEAWDAFVASVEKEALEHVWVSTGTSADDFEKLGALLERHVGLKTICIDVANGHRSVRRCSEASARALA